MKLSTIDMYSGDWSVDAPVLYVSPSRRYGKTDWRVIVYSHERYGACTAYQWRRDGKEWRSEKRWHSHNTNDGCYGGLPKSLRKLWEEFEPNIQAAVSTEKLDRETVELIQGF